MKLAVISFDVATGNEFERADTTLAEYVADNPNAPPLYVIRQEIREIGAYITHHGGVRTELVKR